MVRVERLGGGSLPRGSCKGLLLDADAELKIVTSEGVVRLVALPRGYNWIAVMAIMSVEPTDDKGKTKDVRIWALY